MKWQFAVHYHTDLIVLTSDYDEAYRIAYAHAGEYSERKEQIIAYYLDDEFRPTKFDVTDSHGKPIQTVAIIKSIPSHQAVPELWDLEAEPTL